MELEPLTITVELSILLLNSLDNASMKPLVIFMWIKKEGASKVRGVEYRELRQLGLIFFNGRRVGILATWIKWHLGDRTMTEELHKEGSPHQEDQLTSSAPQA